jgi:hypothetical protein
MHAYAAYQPDEASSRYFPIGKPRVRKPAARQARGTHCPAYFRQAHLPISIFLPVSVAISHEIWAELPLLGMPFLCSSSPMPCRRGRRRPAMGDGSAYWMTG